jgi:cystathionine beta-lyase family protein involved in aluminum resistance
MYKRVCNPQHCTLMPPSSPLSVSHSDTSPFCSPYDTLEEVIGLRGTPGHGSLIEWGITYREQPMASSGSIDWEALKTAIVPGEKSYRL